MKSTLPLDSVRIVSLAPNLPGPACVRRLADWGARVIKVEPPEGDPLRVYARDYYRELHEGMDVRTLDLKSDKGQRELSGLLDTATLFVTAQRPAALKRLGLDAANIRRLWPHLSHLAIVGLAPPDEDVAGHDLTYLAGAGLLDPPRLPPTLMADLLGAERAVSETLLLLRRADASGRGEYSQVALADAATALAAPWRHGLTRPTGLLGGAHAGYGCYRTADGWLALAALEPRFLARLVEALDIAEPDRDSLAAAFAAHPDAHWRAFALRHDLPLTVLPARAGRA
ncbi:MAG: CoA transferase [Betaproteobacteria bacterium]|nr:CoA transferase [Betaproteobacteria bacterium]